jgi:hypothetical protein
MKKVLMLFVILYLAACAKAPVEEMENAAAALTRAENDPDAAAYGEGALVRARNALAAMRTEAEAKRYDAAKTYAAEVVAAAEAALTEGRAAAARVREEAEELLTRLSASLAEAGTAITAAREKKLPLDYEGLSQRLEAARRETEQAAMAAAGNKYREALEKGRGARSIISEIMSILSEEAAVLSRKK